MPTDPQSLVVYAIVVATVLVLTRGVWRRRRRKAGDGHACGASCGCAKPATPLRTLSNLPLGKKRSDPPAGS